MGYVATLLFVHFNFIIQLWNMFFLSPEINTTLQNKSITCIVYRVLFFLCVFFFLDVHYNTMIRRKFCILKRMTFSACHYLTVLVRGAHINYLYLFLKTTYWEYILQKRIIDI